MSSEKVIGHEIIEIKKRDYTGMVELTYIGGLGILLFYTAYIVNDWILSLLFFVVGLFLWSISVIAIHNLYENNYTLYRGRVEVVVKK